MSHVLGLGGRYIYLGIADLKAPMVLTLLFSAFILIVTLLYTFINRKALLFMSCLWNSMICFLQITTVRRARYTNRQGLIEVNDIAVKLIDKIIWIHIVVVIVLTICKLEELLTDDNLKLTMVKSVLELLTIFLFYLKVIIVSERCHVSLVVNA
jgi:hypothetical protein